LQSIVQGDQRLDLLCLEGSVVCGPNGSGRFHRLAGTGKPMMKWVEQLAAVAGHVIAVGSCAAFGGITAAGGNPSEACGLQYNETVSGGLLGKDFSGEQGLPVINIAGCPVHPNWVTETFLQISSGELQQEHLDEWVGLAVMPIIWCITAVHAMSSMNIKQVRKSHPTWVV
jgi:Ni,Fe-hydrogenase I small subunit